MKHYKKRTLALVLASVVTVVGAFGAENYKNSLMAMQVNAGSGDSVNVMLLTKEKYNYNVSPTRIDANTYVIMMPETNSEISANPDLGTNIESIDVKTMPYTVSEIGYTKVTIKVKNNASLFIYKGVYIPATPEPAKIAATQNNQSTSTTEQPTNTQPTSASNSSNLKEVQKSIDKSILADARGSNSIHSSSGVDQTGSVDINKTLQQFQSSPQTSSNVNENDKVEPETMSVSDLNQQAQASNHQELLYMILGIAFVIVTSVFLMLKARDKLVEVTGERPNYDVDDTSSKKVNKKKTKPTINTTINNLDKRYTHSVTMPVSQTNKIVPPAPEEEENVQEVEQVVDLDELLNEQQNKQMETSEADAPVNDALEDFLSSYQFDDDEEENTEDEQENQGINEELYDKYINDNTLEFSKDDVEKIDTLMSTEISDDTIRNVSEYLPSSEAEKKPSPREVLEKFVTTYALEQNISFTHKDIEALNKLINVEIDDDFITDLRTNPSRMQEMQDEIARQKSKPHKTSELLTLNVKDMLPDLSEALKKQGGRRIESEVKPQVVYFSEGYDVSTLKLNNDDLPDLSKEINNEEAYKSRPSDDIEYVDTSYDVQKMSISNELPDLEDMLKHPEKYETPEPEEVQVDEEALLRNITNVTFKPFDDGTREFEVLNDFGPAPTVSDMQEEFNQFGSNFEIINEEDVQEVQDTEKNDFETLYDGKYVDLDKDSKGNKNKDDIDSDIEFEKMLHPENFADNSDDELIQETNDGDELTEYTKEEDLKPSLKEDNIKEDSRERSDITKKRPRTRETQDIEADKLLNKIKNYESRREEKREEREHAKPSVEKANEKTVATPEFCIFEGERYSIVSTSHFTDNIGCYLAKNDNGYSILGFVGDKTFKIKYYEKLNTEKLQSRVSEKLDDGTVRYIVRIGIHKFLLNVKSDDMEFVMDLC